MSIIGAATATCSACGLEMSIPLRVTETRTLPHKLGLTKTVKFIITPDLTRVDDHIRSKHTPTIPHPSRSQHPSNSHSYHPRPLP